MNFKDELTSAMNMLAEDPRVIFLGQSLCYPGNLLYTTLEQIPNDRKLELPVAEELQMGMSIGLSLQGFIPVSIYPRMDFLILAMNQLVNHLDKFEEMSCGQFSPKVIIRTMVGSIRPMYPGIQHCQDYTRGLGAMLRNVVVVRLDSPEKVMPAYRRAQGQPGSFILVEAPPKRQGYD